MINARKESTYQNSAPTCKFCNTQGHTLANCPDMKTMYTESKDKSIHERTYKENYAIQYIDRKNSKKRLTKSTGGKKCGYCREKGHSRRNCPTMIADKELIIKGNKVWRRLWSEKAKQYGLTPASLINVKDRRYDYAQGGYIFKEFLCTVGAELPENLNIFALGEESKKQEIYIPLLGYNPEYGNNAIKARMLVNCYNETLSKDMFAYSYSWGSLTGAKVLSRSSYEFPKPWLDESPIEDIDYALKKWSREQMNVFLTKVTNLIDTYGGKYGIS